MAKRYWTTNDGNDIEYGKIADKHLINILNWIEQKAQDGITFVEGGGVDLEDVWFDERHLKGDEVREHYDMRGLQLEAKRRGLLKVNEK